MARKGATDSVQHLTPSEYFKRISRPYSSLKAETALRDKGILSLCSHIMLDRPKLLIEFGCGQGRLLAALKHTKSDKELANLHYIGIDSDPTSPGICRSSFNELNFPKEAKASFLTNDEFELGNIYLADYVLMVFVIHELDCLNLDQYLARLWQMLRRGGTFLIQDAYVPIYKEIEFICFSPQDIETIMSPCRPTVQIQLVAAGKGLFTVRLTKKETDTPVTAYYLPDLTHSYISVLDRSILREAYRMHEMREIVKGGGEIEINEFAPLVHRIAVKARAYHQLKSFYSFEKGELASCMACGSNNIAIKEQAVSEENPRCRALECKDCGYSHIYALPDREWVFQMHSVFDLLHFLDRGNQVFGTTQSHDSIKILVEMRLHQFFSNNYKVVETVEFLLDRISGIDPNLISKVRRNYDLMHARP